MGIHGKKWKMMGNHGGVINKMIENHREIIRTSCENRKSNFSRLFIELRTHTVCLQLTLVMDILWKADIGNILKHGSSSSVHWIGLRENQHRKLLSWVVKTMVSGPDVPIFSQQNQSTTIWLFNIAMDNDP